MTTQGHSHTTETPLIDYEDGDVLTIQDAFQAIDGTVKEILGREEVRSLALEPLARLRQLSSKGLRMVEDAESLITPDERAAFRAQEQKSHAERMVAINRDVKAALERFTDLNMPVRQLRTMPGGCPSPSCSSRRCSA